MANAGALFVGTGDIHKEIVLGAIVDGIVVSQCIGVVKLGIELCHPFSDLFGIGLFEISLRSHTGKGTASDSGVNG